MKKVYLIRAAHFYKIGISANISSRLKSIQTGCPIKCEYVGYFPSKAPEQLEKELHLTFQDTKTFGEWFDLGDDNINRMVVEFGFKYIIDPSPILREDFQKINTSDELKEARSLTATIEDINKIYQQYCPGNSLSDYGKKFIRKLVIKYNQKIVTECLRQLAGKYDDGEIILDKLTVTCWTYNKYNRHVPPELWKLYKYVVNSRRPHLAEGLISMAMESGLELDENFHNKIKKQCNA